MNPTLFVVIAIVVYLVFMFLLSSLGRSVVGRKLRGVEYDLLLAFVLMSAMLIGIFYSKEEPSIFGLAFSHLGLSILLGALFGTISMLIQYFWLNARLLLSEEMLRMKPKLELKPFLRRVFGLLVLFPISEEIFYRGTLQVSLTYYVGLFSIIITTLLFVTQHMVDPNVRRYYASRKSQVLWFYEGLALGTTLYLTGSLLGCIIAHILANSLSVSARIRKYLCFNQS